MSISVTHRVLAGAFGRSPRITAPASPAPAPAVQSPSHGMVTCLPWEGLYFEDQSGTSQDLETFLASLLRDR